MNKSPSSDDHEQEPEPAMSLPDQTEDDFDAQDPPASPQEESADSETATPPALQEVSRDSGHVNSSDDNSGSEDRPVEKNKESCGNRESETDHANLTSASVLDKASLFSCKYPGCLFTSVNAETYLKHEDTHVDGGAAVCDICNVTFPTYASMRRHHLYMHQGIRTFECQFCTKRFLRKEEFIDHLEGHMRPRPHKCHVCGGTFSYRGQLKLHLSTEHPNSVDKTCHICDFKATSPNAVKLHYTNFHLKQNLEVSDDNQPQDLIQRVQANPSESGAIDLAAVSQNFSFIGGQYPTYVAHGASVAEPGPSDLSRTSKFISVPSIINPRSVIEHSVIAPIPEESRHVCMSSLLGSTSHAGNTPRSSYARPGGVTQVQLIQQERVNVKPEPADESQNSVQPTSTMDVCTTNVVGTASSTSEMPGKRKIHKRSLTDDTASENGSSPSFGQFTEPQNKRLIHTCCRHRSYDESSSHHCREYSRHTFGNRRHNCERRDSDERSLPTDQSDDDRKVFYSRATSTNHQRSAAINNYSSPESQAEQNYCERRSSIVIRDIESCTLTCVYCGIIFPDQTLYLLHRSLHSDISPWKCNLCGKACRDKYDFNSHVISKGHY